MNGLYIEYRPITPLQLLVCDVTDTKPDDVYRIFVTVVLKFYMINDLTYKNLFISAETINPCHLNMVINGLYNFVHHFIGMTKWGWYKW